jgi:hypothetical protein
MFYWKNLLNFCSTLPLQWVNDAEGFVVRKPLPLQVPTNLQNHCFPFARSKIGKTVTRKKKVELLALTVGCRSKVKT